MAELSIHIPSMIEFLTGLLNTPSPTGYHAEAIAYTQKAFKALKVPGLKLSTTTKGALLGILEGQASNARRGVTAHLDTLGLMVREVKANGRLKTSPLGGIVWATVEMEGVTVRAADDRRYRGTMLSVNPSSHVNRDIYRSERTADNMEIRLDVKTSSAAETRALGIEVGDFIFVDPRVEVGEAGFIRSRFLDDKAAVAAIYGALRAMKEAGLKPAQDTAFLIANYEEVGHGGSSGWPFELAELLALDMGAIGESQNSDEFSVSICIKDGGGPYHFDMNNRLRRLASAHNIPYKTDIYVYYSSDGTAYWRAGGDAKVGLIGPGVDASHSYERTHQASLMHTAHLLARYLVDVE